MIYYNLRVINIKLTKLIHVIYWLILSLGTFLDKCLLLASAIFFTPPLSQLLTG
jgi:ABC-type Zn2+ transport system substrate-binding protein/surface adhesin